MHWLQTTYTVRFNLRHNLAGHLFQGRYKAILISPDEPAYFRSVSNYIHLNPVRANLLATGAPLEAFRWSSYPHIITKHKAPPWLEIRRVLNSHALTPRQYQRYMQELCKELNMNPEYGDPEWNEIRRGWFIGSDAFRQELLERLDKSIAGCNRESHAGSATRMHNEEAAKNLLLNAMHKIGVTLETVRQWKTTQPEKQAIVWLLRTSTPVSANWLCEQLHMGHRSNISRAVRTFESKEGPLYKKLKQMMLQCKD